MPRLPSVNAATIIAFLKSKGFLKDHTTGSHFVFYHPLISRRAVVPFHAKDLPRGTILSILHEAGFSREEFLDFLNS